MRASARTCSSWTGTHGRISRRWAAPPRCSSGASHRPVRRSVTRLPVMIGRLPWTTVAPIAAIVLLAASWGRHPGNAILVALAVFLVGAVLAAVHHAEVVAHKVGEPFGSLLLAIAVTVIEVALIVTLMVSGDKDT